MISNRTSLRMYGLPLIDSLTELSEVMRLTKGLLYKMAKCNQRFYRVFDMPKKSGGTRRIAQPGRCLKAVQAWILRKILNRLKSSDACKGFQKGEGILNNALPHVRANAILSLDIENFFPSIRPNRVYRVFRNAGYGSTAAGLLTSLCTFEDGLPQGAPTSPKLSNLVCLRLDARLVGFAGKRGIIYTRYADDLTFSASRAQIVARALPVIRQIVQNEGFVLNEGKTRLAGPSRRRRVTGLVLNEHGVGIGTDRARILRSKIHHLSKVELLAADPTKLNHIQGWLAFVRGVDRKRWKALTVYIDKMAQKYPDSGVIKLRPYNPTGAD